MTPDRMVAALLEHKFDLWRMGSVASTKLCYGPTMSIVHNNVRLNFRILLIIKDSRKGFSDNVGVYVEYLDGPTPCLKMRYRLFVARAPEKMQLITEQEEIITKSNFYGSGKLLPGTLDGLVRQGYISKNSSVLHAFVILFIPEGAFEDPKHLCPVQDKSAQDSWNRDLYLQTSTPTATNSPNCIRFELVSNDDRHFWVHKGCLAKNSDTFKQMFDPEKPEDSRFNYLREGSITLKNVSGGALKEMISFLYLRHTTPDFDRFAMELVSVADMYELKGLKTLCASMLVVQAQNEKDIDELLCLYECALLHQLAQLKVISQSRLEQLMPMQINLDLGVLLRVMMHANRHNYVLKAVCERKLVYHLRNKSEALTPPIVLDLATEANKYNLPKLALACDQWVKKDWDKVSKYAKLSDIFGEIFARVMTSAQDEN